MLRPELKPSRDRLAVRRERSIESEGPLVSAVTDKEVNQQQVRLARRHKPSSIGGHIHANDRVTQSWQGSLA